MKTTEEFYIKRCIELAKNGLGTTYPNPLVGCVIVYNNEIIGEGWHRKSGEPHAEVNAVNSVKDKSLLSKATIYVSLEPCSHFGKTSIGKKVPDNIICGKPNRFISKGMEVSVFTMLLKIRPTPISKKSITMVIRIISIKVLTPCCRVKSSAK